MNADDWQNGEMQAMNLPGETQLALDTMKRRSYGQIQQLRTEGRIELTLQALQQLSRYLAAIPGRKNVIWFSGSFPITIYPDPNLLDPFDTTKHFEIEVKKAAGLLAAAQVAIYPIQAEGLVQDFGYEADASEIGTTRLSQVNQDKSSRNRMAKDFSMDMIAEGTGGKAFYNTNGISDAFTRVLNHGSHYYTLTYTPNNNEDGDTGA